MAQPWHTERALRKNQTRALNRKSLDVNAPTGHTCSVISVYLLSIAGSVLGGLFLVLMPLLLAGAGDWVPILYGAALLAAVLGFNALPASLKARLEGRSA